MEPSSRDAARFSCGTWTALLDDGAGITLRWLHGPVAEGLHTMTSWDLFSWEKNRALQIPSKKMDAEIDMPMGESARNVFIANSYALTGAWSLGCLDLICNPNMTTKLMFSFSKAGFLVGNHSLLKVDPEWVPFAKDQHECAKRNKVLNEWEMHSRISLFSGVGQCSPLKWLWTKSFRPCTPRFARQGLWIQMRESYEQLPTYVVGGRHPLKLDGSVGVACNFV